MDKRDDERPGGRGGGPAAAAVVAAAVAVAVVGRRTAISRAVRRVRSRRRDHPDRQPRWLDRVLERRRCVAARPRDPAPRSADGPRVRRRLSRRQRDRRVGQPRRYRRARRCRTHEPTGARWSVCKGDVFVARFLRDDTLVTAGKDGVIRFWNHAPRRLLGETAAHKGWVYGVATRSETSRRSHRSARTAPRSCGAATATARRAAPAGEPAPDDAAPARWPPHRGHLAGRQARRDRQSRHSLIVWDVRTGDLVLGPFEHDDVVLAVAFHPQIPSKLLTRDGMATIRLWPSGRVSRIGSVPCIRSGFLPRATPSRPPAGTSRCAVRAAIRPRVGMRARDEDPVPSGLSFSPDSRSLAVAYRTGDVRVTIRRPAPFARR